MPTLVHRARQPRRGFTARRDRLHRAGPIPGPLLLQRAQSQRRETVNRSGDGFLHLSLSPRIVNCRMSTLYRTLRIFIMPIYNGEREWSL